MSFRVGVQVTANHPAERDLAAAAAAARDQPAPRPAAGDDRGGFLLVPEGGAGRLRLDRQRPGRGRRELHNPHYDFNDAVLPAASGFLAEVAKRALAGG